MRYLDPVPGVAVDRAGSGVRRVVERRAAAAATGLLVALVDHPDGDGARHDGRRHARVAVVGGGVLVVVVVPEVLGVRMTMAAGMRRVRSLEERAHRRLSHAAAVACVDPGPGGRTRRSGMLGEAHRVRPHPPLLLLLLLHLPRLLLLLPLPLLESPLLLFDALELLLLRQLSVRQTSYQIDLLPHEPHECLLAH